MMTGGHTHPYLPVPRSDSIHTRPIPIPVPLSSGARKLRLTLLFSTFLFFLAGVGIGSWLLATRLPIASSQHHVTHTNLLHTQLQIVLLYDLPALNVTTFELQFRQTVSQDLGIAFEQVYVENISAGSVVVRFFLLGAPEAELLFQQRVVNENSTLRNTELFRGAVDESIGVIVTTTACSVCDAYIILSRSPSSSSSSTGPDVVSLSSSLSSTAPRMDVVSSSSSTGSVTHLASTGVIASGTSAASSTALTTSNSAASSSSSTGTSLWQTLASTSFLPSLGLDECFTYASAGAQNLTAVQCEFPDLIYVKSNLTALQSQLASINGTLTQSIAALYLNPSAIAFLQGQIQSVNDTLNNALVNSNTNITALQIAVQQLQAGQSATLASIVSIAQQISTVNETATANIATNAANVAINGASIAANKGRIDSVNSTLLSLIASPLSQVVEQYYLVACLGQSNCVGYNGAPGSDPLNVQNDRILQMAIGTGPNPNYIASAVSVRRPGAILHAREPLLSPVYSSNSSGIGPLVQACKTYLATAPLNMKCLVLQTAVSSTTISRWHPTTGDLYKQAVKYVNLAISLVRPVDMLLYWHQGESDSTGIISTTAYQNSLVNVIRGLRSNITGASNALVVVGQMVPQYTFKVSGPTSGANVDLAHQDLPRILERTAFLPGEPLGQDGTGNAIHYSGAAQRAMGDKLIRLGRPWAQANYIGAGILPGAPTALSVPSATITHNSAVIWWNVSTVPSRLTDYSIEYRVTDSGPTFTAFAHTAFIAPQTLTITSLTPNTQYDVRVAGVNDAGTGAYSNIAQFTTLHADHVANLFVTVTTSTAITLSWAVPASPTITGITGYNIYFRLNSVGGAWTSFAANQAGTTATITGLTAATVYDLAVEVVGSATGPKSILLAVDTQNWIVAPYALFEAHRGVTFDSKGYVLSMADQSGNGRALGLSSNPNRPLTGSIGDRPAIAFNAGTYLTNAAAFPAGVDYTIVWIGSIADTSVLNGQLFGSGCRLAWMKNSVGLYYGHTVLFDNIGPLEKADVTLETDVVYMISVVYSFTGNTLQFYMNGIPMGSAGTSVPACADTILSLGGATASTLAPLPSNVLLFGVWNSALTSTDLTNQAAIWQTRFGVTFKEPY